MNKNKSVSETPTWEEEYPLSTFYGETKRELVEFVQNKISEAEKEAYERGFAEGKGACLSSPFKSDNE